MGKQNEKLLTNIKTYEQQNKKSCKNAIHSAKGSIRQKPVKHNHKLNTTSVR